MKSLFHASSGVAGVGMANNYALNTAISPNLFGSGALLYTTSFATKSINGGTFSKMWINIVSNTRTSDTLIRFINNGVVGNQSITIPAGATGLFIDNTNTDTVVAGDDYAIGVTFPVAGGAINHVAIGGIYEDNVAPYLSKFGLVGGVTLNGVTRFGGLGGNSIAQTVDGIQAYTAKTNGVLKNLGVRVYANTHTSDIVLTTRINGVDGNCTVTIPASTTGYFEDLVNSDTISIGDEVNLEGAGLAATGTANMLVSTDFDGDSLGSIHGNVASAIGLAAATTYYLRMNCSGTNALTQAQAQMYIPGSFTIKNPRIRFWTNNSTDVITCTLQKNGVDTAVSFTVPASPSGTGEFGDFVNELDVVEGDLLNWKVETAAAGTSTIYGMGFDYIETPAPPSGSGGGSTYLLMGV